MQPDKDGLYPDFVCLRDTFRYAHNERNLVFDRLDDRVGGEGRRDVYNGGIWFGFSDSLLQCVNDRLCGTTHTTRLFNAAEHRKAKMRLAGPTGRNTTNHFGAVGNGFPGVKCCLSRKAYVTTGYPVSWRIRTVFPVNPWHMTLVSLW